MKHIFAILLFIFVARSATAQSPGGQAPPPDLESVYRNITGTAYVPFDLTTLDGKRFTSASCIGKVTFINFWFEGCVPCRNEFAKLNELYDSLKDNPSYQFVAVTFDEKEGLRDFIRQFGLRYPIATVNDQWEEKRLNYQLGYPTSIILDKDGKVGYIGMKGITENDNSAFAISIHTILAKMKQ